MVRGNMIVMDVVMALKTLVASLHPGCCDDGDGGGGGDGDGGDDGSGGETALT